jgi:hypothetical protein
MRASPARIHAFQIQLTADPPDSSLRARLGSSRADRSSSSARPDARAQLLHRANVVSVFKQVRRKAVTHRVRTDPLREASLTRRPGNRLLDHRLV